MFACLQTCLPVCVASRPRAAQALVVFSLLVGVIAEPAAALIIGDDGNSPVREPGWPDGAEVIFNRPARIAWWEGPPFGGGQWHAECRGDAETFNAVLADFAKLDVKNKRLVLHDGVGRSFWLNPNNEPEKREAARVDWQFMVWVPASWTFQQTLSPDINAASPQDAETGPPAQIDVFTGGDLRWADVTLPPGINVIDQRLEANGFKLADGTVLEGSVIDVVKREPIAATVQLQRIESRPEGGYRYETVSETSADTHGRWVLKNAPTGRHRIIVSADGYVPRIAGHIQVDDQPGWHEYDTNLSRPATISGRVTDAAGQPLADATVRLGDVVSADESRYESPDKYEVSSDTLGRFCIEQAPVGTATVRVYKPGYARPGLGKSITIPTDGLSLRMSRAAGLRVTVDFPGTARPEQYIVNIEPEGGSTIGSWGGSAHVNDQNVVNFENVPPGNYVVDGHPNPTREDQRTDPITIELSGGETTDVTLMAK